MTRRLFSFRNLRRYLGGAMPRFIKDNAATEAEPDLAARPRITPTDAVQAANAETLGRDARALAVGERVASIVAQLDALPSTGAKADKAFFDREWGDRNNG